MSNNLTPEQKAEMAARIRYERDAALEMVKHSSDPNHRWTRIHALDADALTYALNALEAEPGKDKRIAELEDELEAEQEATTKDAALWDRECARALARLADMVGFKPDPDGDTAGDIGEHVEEAFRGAIRRAEDHDALALPLPEAANEIVALRKRIETLEDELEAEQEATTKDAASWDRDASRTLKRLAARTGFEYDSDGNTADYIGEHIEQHYWDTLTATQHERDALAATQHERDALAAQLVTMREALHVSSTPLPEDRQTVLAALALPLPEAARQVAGWRERSELLGGARRQLVLAVALIQQCVYEKPLSVEWRVGYANLLDAVRDLSEEIEAPRAAKEASNAK